MDNEITITNKMIERILIERNKTVDNMIAGEILKIATENGIDTKIILNEKAIVEALKKQIPTEPLEENQYYGIGKCPSCGAVFRDKSTKYCGNCGQALDWRDAE